MTTSERETVLNLAVARRASKVKFWSGIALLLFAGVFAVAHFVIDNLEWNYQGAGVLVWIPFGISLLYAWFTAETLTWQLKKDTSFHPLENIGRWFVRRNAPEDVLEAVQEVGDTVGYTKGTYTPYAVEDDTANAFAAGTGNGKIVALHTGLLDMMNIDEIKGVVAHEFGHLKANDIFILVFTTAAIMSYIWIGQFFIRMSRIEAIFGGAKKKDDKKSPPWWWVLAMLAIGLIFLAIGYIFAPLVAAFISRQREALADAFAVAAGYGEGLRSALRKLQRVEKTSPIKPVVASLYINKSQASGNSHPPLTWRDTEIGKMLEGFQGKVPDIWESLLWSAFKFLVLPGIGAYMLISKQCCVEMPGLFGVPYIYMAAWAWLMLVDMLYRNISVKAQKPNTNPLVAIAAIALLVGLWAAGLYTIDQSMTLQSVIPYTTVAPIFFWIWAAKPVTAAFGDKLGILGLISDETTSVSFVYAVVVILNVLYMTLPY